MVWRLLVFVAVTCVSVSAEPGHRASEPVVDKKTLQAPACSFESLTDGCRIFDSKKKGDEKITLKDGTFIPNFPAIIAGKPISDFKEDEVLGKKSEALKSRSFALQKDLGKLLSGVPTLKLHSDFRIYLRDPQKIMDLGEVIRRIDAKDEASPDMLFWWPPNRPQPPGTPREEFVPFKDIAKTFKNIFPTKAARNEIARLAREAEAIAEEAALAGKPDLDREKHKQKQRFVGGDAPSVVHHSVIRQLGKVSDARVKRVAELFEFAKKSAVEILRRGRKDGDLSVADKAAIARVQAVVFPNNPADPKVKASCMGVFPNAYYYQEDNSVNLCRNYYNFPDTELVSTLGHEIFHAIDPCGSQFATYQINSEALGKLRAGKEGLPIPEIQEDNELYRTLKTIEEASARTNVTSLGFTLQSPSGEAEKFFQKGKAADRVLTRIADGISFHPDRAKSSYVLKDVYACLKTDKGGGFRSESPDEIRKLAREVTEARAKFNHIEPGYDAKKDAADIEKAFSAHPECIGTENRSQMGETIADWGGTQVLAKYLQGKTLSTPQEKLGVFSFFAVSACLRRAEARQKGRADGPSAIVNGAEDTRREIRDEHPDPVKRMDDLFLREPTIARALCGAEPRGHFCREGEL